MAVSEVEAVAVLLADQLVAEDVLRVQFGFFMGAKGPGRIDLALPADQEQGEMADFDGLSRPLGQVLQRDRLPPAVINHGYR